MELCEQAMTTLLQTYITDRPPSEWKSLFKEACNIGFMVKYMFREDLQIAKQKFVEAVGNKDNFRKMPRGGEVQEALKHLADHTLDAYGDVGIFDPEELARIDFLNRPELLVQLVQGSKNRMSRVDKADMLMMTEVTTEWMRYMVDKKFPPLTPHHTQAFTVIMMARCFQEHLSDFARQQKAKAKAKAKLELRAFIAQLATGEGKSIVIAMLAVFMTQLYGMKVHVLENNEGLLERDYKQNKPFYDRFNIKSSTDLADDDAQITYCLKARINKHFLGKILKGTLDAELKRTVIIVDEVDDLVVNERPNNTYVKADVERTPDLTRCYQALREGVTSRMHPDPLPSHPNLASAQSLVTKPIGVDELVWQTAQHWVKHCENELVEGTHYRVIADEETGKDKVIMLDEFGEKPKVPLSAPWLTYMNYKLCGKPPEALSRYATVCTPYIFNKYAGIFGLTGSVGGAEELKYLTKTYSAVKFDVPRFLDTCVGDARKEVKNHGVEILDGEDKLAARVVDLCEQYFKKVPVLVITSGADEIRRILLALAESSVVPYEEVQRFSEFDEEGKSLKDDWQTIIDDSTKRLGGVEDNRCRVTVTDRFGGRGHDFQVVDKEANANGGMLVIATSIPDEREWIQWKGRTARQDRPGQYFVILNQKAAPFTLPECSGLANKIGKLKLNDLKIEELLGVADSGIGQQLANYKTEQESGEKLNELTELYYVKNPRKFDDDWPSQSTNATDLLLRTFLTDHVDKPPDQIRKLAKDTFGIELSKPAGSWW